jgi:hypothetical protein
MICGCIELPQELEFIGWDHLCQVMPKESECLQSELLSFNKRFPKEARKFIFTNT